MKPEPADSITLSPHNCTVLDSLQFAKSLNILLLATSGAVAQGVAVVPPISSEKTVGFKTP